MYDFAVHTYGLLYDREMIKLVASKEPAALFDALSTLLITLLLSSQNKRLHTRGLVVNALCSPSRTHGAAPGVFGAPVPQRCGILPAGASGRAQRLHAAVSPGHAPC